MDAPVRPAVAPTLPPLAAFAECRERLACMCGKQIVDELGREAAEPRPVQLYVAFCTAQASRNSAWKTFFRKVAASYTGDAHHVELVFKWDNDAITACSVNFSEPVHFNAIDSMQHYPASSWCLYRIDFSEIEMFGVFFYVCRQLDKPMDAWGLYTNFLPVFNWFVCEPPPSAHGEEPRWFCSQLAAAALKWVRPDMFAGVNPRATTPLALAVLLQRADAFGSGSLKPVSAWNLDV